jgi:hypothetical protein
MLVLFEEAVLALSRLYERAVATKTLGEPLSQQIDAAQGRGQTARTARRRNLSMSASVSPCVCIYPPTD